MPPLLITERTARTRDEVDIAVQDYGGSGPDLLLLHGGTRTLADWVLTAPLLTSHFRVLAMDFRGHGRSGAVPLFSLAGVMEDIRAVIETLELDQPVIGGHSLGGIMSVRYAALHGGVRGVVNVDGGGAGAPDLLPSKSPTEAERILDMTSAQSVGVMLSAPAAGDSAWVRQQIEAIGPALEELGIDLERGRELVERGFREVGDDRYELSPNPVVNASMYLSLRSLDLPVLYRAIEVPLFVVQAKDESPQSEDPEIQAFAEEATAQMVKQLDELAAAMPNLTVWRPVSGHMVHWELAAELAARINGWAEEVLQS